MSKWNFTPEQRERRRLYAIQWRKKNPQRRYENHKRWCEENPEKVLAHSATKRTKLDPQKSREYFSKWRKANKEKMAAHFAAYCLAHPERRRETCQKWDRRNRHIKRRQVLRYRAKKIEFSTPEQIAEADAKIIKMLSVERTDCAYCSKNFMTLKMEVDHIFPISRGGPHSADNITMACRNCNRSKNNKIFPTEWRPKK